MGVLKIKNNGSWLNVISDYAARAIVAAHNLASNAHADQFNDKQNKTDNSLCNLDEQGRVVQSILAVDTKVGDKADTTALTAEATARANADSGKVDKLVTTGQKVYSHNGATQGEMDVASAQGVPIATSVSSTSDNNSVVTPKGVYDYVEKSYELIETVTLTEAVRVFTRSSEPNGTAYNFKKLMVVFECSSNPNVSFYINLNSDTIATSKWSIVTYSTYKFEIEGGMLLGYYVSNTSANNVPVYSSTPVYGNALANSITSFKGTTGSAEALIPSGTIIKIYAVRR